MELTEEQFDSALPMLEGLCIYVRLYQEAQGNAERKTRYRLKAKEEIGRLLDTFRGAPDLSSLDFTKAEPRFQILKTKLEMYLNADKRVKEHERARHDTTSQRYFRDEQLKDIYELLRRMVEQSAQ